MYDNSINLAVIVLLLVTNAFFVAAEFALVKARGARIRSMAGMGNFSARLTVRIQRDLEAYLAACQLGITMASLGLGWVGEPAVAAMLHPILTPLGLGDAGLHTISFLIGFVIFSSLHIVIGEQVPKTYAIRKPEPVAIMCAIPLRFFFLLLFPLNWLLNASSRGVLRILGVDEAPHVEILSGTEIQGLVDTSAEHGEIDEERAKMISNLFSFDERAVARVMTPRIDCDVLNINNNAQENVEIMQSTRHSRFPLVQGDKESLIGIILMKDLVSALLKGEETPWTKLEQYCREPLIVPESLKVSRLFDTMRKNKAHIACVVNEYGTLGGIITLEDLLEEIVGEISDETDEVDDPVCIRAIDGGWEVHGLMSLADIERDVGFYASGDLNANTVSGLFMNRLERIPVVGDTIAEGDFRFTVKTMKDRHVELALVEVDNGDDERGI